MNPVILKKANTHFLNGRELLRSQGANPFRKLSQREMTKTSGERGQCDPTGSGTGRQSQTLGHYFLDNGWA